MTQTATDLYEKRIKNNSCTRCGGAKAHAETRRKCAFCRSQESQWRKNTRKSKNRDIQEQIYHMKTWAKRCLTHSKRSDNKYNRAWSTNNYVTEPQLVMLRKLQNNLCIYCDTKMQVFDRRRPNGLTIERIVAGNRAHDDFNVLLACHRCNCKRVGNSRVQESPLRIYYNLWMAHRKRITA